MLSSRCLVVAAAMSLGVLAGCGSNREAAQPAVDTTAVEPVRPPGAESPSWLAEVRQRESELERIIEQGQLAQVHGQAEKIQALLKQVAAQSSDLSEDRRQQVATHLGAAGRLVDELHDAGDAGDLTTTRAKFQEFQTHVRALEGAFGVSQP